MSTSQNTHTHLGDRFDKHLFACSALAGVSAIVGAMVAAPIADADVTYKSVGVTIPYGYILDLNVDLGTFLLRKIGDPALSGTEFGIASSTYGPTVLIAVLGSTSKDLVAYSTALDAAHPYSKYWYADNLAKGTVIDSTEFPAKAFTDYTYIMYASAPGPKSSKGTTYGPVGEFYTPPAAATANYIAIKFATSATTYSYGWIGISLSSTFVPTVTGFAYETFAGTAITAGVVPEPSTTALGLLAFGAGGVSAWRRRREHEAVKETA